MLIRSIVAIAGLLVGFSAAAEEPKQDCPEAFYYAQSESEQLLKAKENAARAAELEALKQYEQADFEFMRGDAELDKKSN